MSNKNLTGFEDQARHVSYAYDNTQRQYDEHPPNDDMVPIAAAINAWTLICGCYMGIEQTMKLLIRMRGGVSERILKNTHNLECLYSLLDPSEWDVVAAYYRVYRSLHNFDTGNTALETAEEFIQYVGKGYVVWRYILSEDPEATNKLPKMHLGLMLETWRALADLVQHHVVCGYKYRTLENYLEDYIVQGVFRDAEMDDEWQAASQDENSNIEFSEICDWLHHKGTALEAGIDLFNHHAQGTGNSVEASPLLRQVLLRAADKALGDPPPPRPTDGRTSPCSTTESKVAVWLGTRSKECSSSCPAPGFDKKANHELAPIDVSSTVKRRFWLNSRMASFWLARSCERVETRR